MLLRYIRKLVKIKKDLHSKDKEWVTVRKMITENSFLIQNSNFISNDRVATQSGNSERQRKFSS